MDITFQFESISVFAIINDTQGSTAGLMLLRGYWEHNN